MTTRSKVPANLVRVFRNASRIRRFQRLRITALPTFRETEIPSRLCSNPLGIAKTISTLFAAERRASNTSLNSGDLRIRAVCGKFPVFICIVNNKSLIVNSKIATQWKYLLTFRNNRNLFFHGIFRNEKGMNYEKRRSAHEHRIGNIEIRPRIRTKHHQNPIPNAINWFAVIPAQTV